LQTKGVTLGNLKTQYLSIITFVQKKHRMQLNWRYLFTRNSTYILSVGCFLLCLSCNPARKLTEGSHLYTGAKLVKVAPDSVKLDSELEEQITDAIKPAPNASLLGWYYKLGIHNLARKQKLGETDKQHGFRYWLKYKVGEPPVMLESVNLGRTSKLIENKFYNAGYFDVNVTPEIIKDDTTKQGSVTYTAKYSTPYYLNERIFPSDTTSALAQAIKQSEAKTLLKKGINYNLITLKEERERISLSLKNKGFFYFNPDFLLFQVDTTIGGRLFNIYMKIKDEMPEKAFKKFTINEVFIFPEFDNQSATQSGDTVLTSAGYHYISNQKLFRPEVIARYVFINRGKEYRFSDHQLTLQKLTSLDVFKFVNVRFQENEDGDLNAYIYLTPFKKKYLKVEANAVSKSNGFTGPELNTSFSNRNAFHGAEKLTFDLNTSYETQISGQQQGLNSYQLGTSVSLRVFRFVTPFGIRQISRFVPSTQLKVGYDLLNRVSFFRTSSFNTFFGYKWRETSTRSHELNPITINYVSLGQTSETFDNILANNQLLARSFENQFIIGTNYSFTYNNQVREKKKNYVYFNGSIDLSGNLLHSIQSVVQGRESTDEDPFRIFNRPYSQYFRFLVETRFYEDFGNKVQLALRGITGLGVPFGNSSTLPYIKQFYIGGTNSIRAFPARSVGPGGYNTPDSLANALFLDQVGDIKIEANAELRFDINSFLKWAVFTDIGNIWLTKNDPDRPNGNFEFKDFYRELAVGIGTGMRIDASYIIVRFDLGIPVRKPGNAPGSRWVFREFDFGSSQWRSNNLVLNIAIGYPF